MAVFKPAQYAAHLNKNMAKFNAESRPLRELVYKLVSVADKRIFDRGESASGGPIGIYSSNPLYVNPTLATNRKKFATKGKAPKSKSSFKNGKARHTRYFANYTAYKMSQGMALLGNRVNLQITKHFRRAFLTKVFIMNNTSSGFVARLGVMPSNVNPIGKIHGIMKDKYPLAFKFSRKEKKFFESELKKLFIKGLK